MNIVTRVTLTSQKILSRIQGFILLFLVLLVGSPFSSCKKFLDKPSSKLQVIPQTLEDLQALMENLVSATSDLPEGLADNYFYFTSTVQALAASASADDRNRALHYIWQGNTNLNGDGSWDFPYMNIYTFNLILDVLSDIAVDDGNKNEWNRIKGQALFKRGVSYWFLTQVFCKPYSSSASSDLGLPLRLNVDFEEKSVRSSLEQTYHQIISDLETAADILPEVTLNPTMPNKAAAFGLLSRVYLSMRAYTLADQYADSCLSRNSSLMDYNTLNSSSALPIPLFNKEVIYYDNAGSTMTGSTNAIIDTLLYRSYDLNDLRKAVFFKPKLGNSGLYNFQGSYTQYAEQCFSGIATDEIYLTKAECAARAGKKDSALIYLNTLMRTRWKNTVTYVSFTATDAQDALNKILVERRKELLFRCLRWTDLRRLNLEGANISLTRVIGVNTYTLPPNDLRWVVLIPQTVINFTGMEQNPR
jgi:hypothetical protein